MNSVTSAPLDEKKAWKDVKKITSPFYDDQNCSTWVDEEQIVSNIQDLYERLDISNVSVEVRNLSMINIAADMFVQLNICPKNEQREEWKAIYQDLITRSKSVSSLLAALFRIMKRFPGDGKVLAEAMLRKLERSGVKKKLISVNITGFWLRQEPKERQCRVSVRPCVTLFKRALKMKSSSILKGPWGF